MSALPPIATEKADIARGIATGPQFGSVVLV